MEMKAAVRGAVLDMALDLIGQKAEKYHTIEGRLCQDCPLLAELVRELRLARCQDKEEEIEKMIEHYGLS
jgi:hypothetical protein